MERHAYEELAQLELSHWWYCGMRCITEQLLHSVIGGRHDLGILDAGCGTGASLLALMEFGQPFGIDNSSVALSYAAQKSGGKVVQATIEAIPFAHDCFDLVTSFDVIYCREVADDTRALKELARVIRPGGYLLVRVPALSTLRGTHDDAVHGVRRYTATVLRHRLEAAQLRPVRLTYANSILLPLIFVARRFQKLVRGRGDVTRSDLMPTPALLNRALFNLLKLESRWIRAGRDWKLGVSLFAVARKPVGPA